LHRADSPEEWLDDMRAQIAARAAPKQDNYTAVAVWVGEPNEMTIARVEDTRPRAL
jgi:hypothetical protein